MQVSCYDIFIDNPFITGFPGVSKTIKYFSERCMISDVSASAVVFKSNDRSVKQRAVKNNIPDQPLRFPFCRDVENLKSFNQFFVSFIIFSK